MAAILYTETTKKIVSSYKLIIQALMTQITALIITTRISKVAQCQQKIH